MAHMSFAEVSRLVGDPSACFTRVSSRQHVTLSPKFIGKLKAGVSEELDNELKLYSERLGGVVIAYSNLQVVGRHGQIIDEYPGIHLDVLADFILFRPSVGSTLKAVVNKIGKDHVGCLVHGCFNASIKKTQETCTNVDIQKLCVGQEIVLKVFKLITQNGVLSIRGNVVETSLCGENDSLNTVENNSLQSTEGYLCGDWRSKEGKTKHYDSNNDTGPLETCESSNSSKTLHQITDSDMTGDLVDSVNVEDEECSRKKKKKKKKHKKDKSVDQTSFSSEITDLDDSGENKKRKKHKENVTKNSLSDSVVVKMEPMEYQRSHSKKKKKHSMDNTSLGHGFSQGVKTELHGVSQGVKTEIIDSSINKDQTSVGCSIGNSTSELLVKTSDYSDGKRKKHKKTKEQSLENNGIVLKKKAKKRKHDSSVVHNDSFDEAVPNKKLCFVGGGDS